MFKPGNPPASKAKRDYGKPQNPDYLNGYGDEIISSGCKCLDIPKKTVVVSKTTTKLSTATVSEIVVILIRTDSPTENHYDNHDTHVYIYSHKNKDSFGHHNHTLPCVFQDQRDSFRALTSNSVCRTSPLEYTNSALRRCLISKQP